MIRLNKYLSVCGVTSRRGAEVLIREGRVTVNRRKVREVGTVIDETADKVRVDNRIVRPVQESVYIVLNKPTEVMTTLHDPFRRKTITNYLKKVGRRVYPVGRLDFDTEGVLLLTNDGDLAYRLAHPKYEVPKVYEARVAGKFQSVHSGQIARGVKLEDGAVGRALVNIIEYSRRGTLIRLTLTEGRKREVKQLCKAVGHPVKKLTRIEFAGITARGLKAGEWRPLTEDEVDRLKSMVNLK